MLIRKPGEEPGEAQGRGERRRIDQAPGGSPCHAMPLPTVVAPRLRGSQHSTSPDVDSQTCAEVDVQVESFPRLGARGDVG